MKKIFYSMFAMAMTAMTFISCDDVPAPYDINGNGGNGGNNGAMQTIYSEGFDEGTTNFEYKSVSGYANVWSVKVNNGKGYLNASAYANSKSNAAEAWAYSPAINLSDSKAATLSFRHAINKITDKTAIPERMTVWVSTDKTNWTQLTVPTYPTGDSWTFVGSGDIDLTAYCGQEKVYIGFKYISIDGDAGTWEIDEFTITGDGTPMTTPEKPDTPSNFEAGQYFFVYKNGAESKACEFKPANATANYGYLNPTTTTTITSEGVLTDAEANLFTFTAVEGGFTIQKSTGEYLFVEGTYKSFQLSSEVPSSNYIWSVTIDDNGLATIKNTGNNFVVRFSTHNNFAPTNATTGDLPMLVKQGGKIDITGGTTGGNTGDNTGGNTGGTTDNNLTKTVSDDNTTVTFSNEAATAGSSVEIDLTTCGLAHQTAEANFTLQDVSFKFEANGGTTPKYWKTGSYDEFRMYAKNILTVTPPTGKTIKSIVFTCTSSTNNSGTTYYIGNDQLYATSSNGAVVVCNDWTTTSGGTQFRIKKVTITFAQ